MREENGVIGFFKRDDPPSNAPTNTSTGALARPAPDSTTPASPEIDDGLTVPPFRAAEPAPARHAADPIAGSPGPHDLSNKESPMARSPFAPAPSAPLNQAASPMATGAPMGFRTPSSETTERRTLVVGRGISVQGLVQDAERLVVEGHVEATMITATELAITQGGVFKGEVEVEEAEIAGTIDGTLTARHALIVRGTGRVLGTARCRRLQVEDGGQITGRIEMLSDTPSQHDPVVD